MHAIGNTYAGIVQEVSEQKCQTRSEDQQDAFNTRPGLICVIGRGNI